MYKVYVMKNVFNTLRTTLFEASNVVVYKIPPGESLLSKWNIKDLNVIWTGNVRLIEYESSIDGEVDDSLIYNILEDNVGGKSEAIDFSKKKEIPESCAPQKTLRLKLELYNTTEVSPDVGSLVGTHRDEIWAEVWYNPLRPIDYLNWNTCIANDGQETIQAIPESSKYYKIIAQLPGTGCNHANGANEDIDGHLLNIALGLKFMDTFDAISFSEGLNIYKRRFSDFIDQLNYELAMNKLDDLHINKVGSPVIQLDPHDYTNGQSGSHESDYDSIRIEQDFDTEDSESDFGDFVG